MPLLETLNKDTRRQDQIAVIRCFGERMQRAREYAGYSLNEAAELFGYANSSKLSKIENASDTISIPLWIVPRATDLYKTTVSFLFGYTEVLDQPADQLAERQLGATLYTVASTQGEFSLDQQAKAIQIIAGRVAVQERATTAALATAQSLANLVQQIPEQAISPSWRNRLLQLAIETAEQAAGIDQQLQQLHPIEETNRQVGVNVKPQDMQRIQANRFNPMTGQDHAAVVKLAGA